MSVKCNCDIGLGNLGLPSCIPKFGIPNQDIYVNRYNSDGELNKIDTSVVIDEAFLEARLNDPDPTKRWYLTPPYKNVTSERADTEFQEFDDASKAKIRKGIRSETHIYPEKGTDFLAKLESNECIALAKFTVSTTNNIMGKERSQSDTALYPIWLDAFDTKWTTQLPTAVEQVMVSYDWVVSECDAKIQFIGGDQVTATFPDKNGLIDVYGTVSNEAALSFDIKLNYTYGYKGAELPFNGLELADISSLTNVTTDTAMTVDTVTDNGGGNYTIDYTGVTIATDVLSLVISKLWFDFSTVDDIEIVY